MKNNFSLLSLVHDKEETSPRLHTVQLLWEVSELSVRISEFRGTKTKKG